ncbi:type II CAAX endopeptidase family protein [Aureivirga sp. CE67]|uniref:type II CAAX endopeptidase family protein n=1 Tax=Aureivirga sp. CE67 TaxID=1788983 RepID=UPI0018CB36DD|nr:type II CAAX endopeptidase family protein [Aureivirga sp. CE67]
MSRFVVKILLLLNVIFCFSQNNNAEYLYNKIEDSNKAQFQYYLKKYEDSIQKNPEDLESQIQRCLFLEKYIENQDNSDSSKQENLRKLAQFQNQIYSQFRNHPKTILYQLNHLSPAKHKQILENAEYLIKTNKGNWTNNQKSIVYEHLANLYLEKNNKLAIKYAENAAQFNPKKDYSFIIARAHYKMGNKNTATEVLTNSLDKNHHISELSKKANLLFEIGKVDLASNTYKRVLKEDSTYVLNKHVAKLFEQNHEYKLARKFLVKDTVGNWNKIAHLQELLNFDIKYSDPETTIETYRRLQQLNPKDDFFGIKRLDIFFKDPTSTWKWSEVLHVLIFIGFIACLLLIPFLWILPIIGLEVVLKNRNIKIIRKTPFDWSIRFFWYVSFCYLLATSLVVFVFEYQDFIAIYLKVGEVESYTEQAISTLAQAHEMIFFVFLMFITTLFTLNKKRLEYYYNSDFSIYNMVLYGFIFVIFNSLLLKGLDYIFHVEEVVNISYFSAAKEEVAAVLKEYGFPVAFLLVAIIVPIYEETIFRGIILGSVEKHIGFRLANIFQACLFGLVHGSLQLFIFYFIFGFILGIVAKKGQSLLANIVFHGINNMVVLYSLTNF